MGPRLVHELDLVPDHAPHRPQPLLRHELPGQGQGGTRDRNTVGRPANDDVSKTLGIRPVPDALCETLIWVGVKFCGVESQLET